LPELENKLQTNVVNGLDPVEAEKRLMVVGKNCLTEKKAVPWYLKLLHELTSVFACMMWAGAILSFIAYGLTPEDPSNLYLAIVLVVVVSVTGIMAFF
jgi:sodium/potassium-transporting ATPase subunit alpha